MTCDVRVGSAGWRPGMAVEEDVVALPDEQGVTADLGLDALAQCQVFLSGLERDKALEVRVELEALGLRSRPIGGFCWTATLCFRPAIGLLGCRHGCVSGVFEPATTSPWPLPTFPVLACLSAPFRIV